jgi:hypothetical protein
VRRRLGAELRPQEPPAAPPLSSRVIDTGLLFESQLSRLSASLRELRAIDRQREAELRALRERLAILDAVHQVGVAKRLTPTLQRLDALIEEASRLLQPPPAPPPTATLFERMRAQTYASAPGSASRELLVAWAAALIDLRAQLAEFVQE